MVFGNSSSSGEISSFSRFFGNFKKIDRYITHKISSLMFKKKSLKRLTFSWRKRRKKYICSKMKKNQQFLGSSCVADSQGSRLYYKFPDKDIDEIS